MEDSQIIEMFTDRNKSAVDEVREKYGGLCYSIAFNILCNAEDAEECINDLYINLWSAIPPAYPSNFKAYVCKITRNLSLLRLRYNEAGKRDVRLTVSISELEENRLNSGNDPLEESVKDEAEDSSVGRLISDFLRQQKPRQREVFIRRYWFMDSVKEIAEDYSFSESKVKSMLFRTRSKLKKYLKKEGLDI